MCYISLSLDHPCPSTKNVYFTRVWHTKIEVTAGEGKSRGSIPLTRPQKKGKITAEERLTGKGTKTKRRRPSVCVTKACMGSYLIWRQRSGISGGYEQLDIQRCGWDPTGLSRQQCNRTRRARFSTFFSAYPSRRFSFFLSLQKHN
ncbi:unnamed protein product [Ectocarpus sp. 8 AP-2014]